MTLTEEQAATVLNALEMCEAVIRSYRYYSEGDRSEPYPGEPKIHEAISIMKQGGVDTTTHEKCFHCDAINNKDFICCYKCGLWPDIDYSLPSGVDRAIERRTKPI